MKIVQPSFVIEEPREERGGMAMIEMAARTCYKSESGIREGSSERMVRMLIQHQHFAMLEHGSMIFFLDDKKKLENLEDALRMIARVTGHHIRLNMTCENGRPIVSGNMRAWRELMESQTITKYYFSPHIDSAYLQWLVLDESDDKSAVELLGASLLTPLEQRVHRRQTVRFIIDRGVSHEFVRHRVMSFAMESTRYCNYSHGKFDGEITVIEPCFLEKDTDGYMIWETQCRSAEWAYFRMLDYGLQPQEARSVLPHSIKTELVMTGTLGEWDHFFDLRARQKTGPAHPQAVEVAVPLMEEMKRRFPDVFGRGE